MKRDWDVIRAILVAAEQKAPNAQLHSTEVLGYDQQIVAAHMDMLHDAGYIDARFVRSSNFSAILIKTTLAGYDLLDTMRSDSLWGKIKATAREKGIELTFDLVKMLAAKIGPEYFDL